MHNFLDFEKPIAELEGKIEELRHLTGNDEVNIADEVSRLQEKLTKLLDYLQSPQPMKVRRLEDSGSDKQNLICFWESTPSPKVKEAFLKFNMYHFTLRPMEFAKPLQDVFQVWNEDLNHLEAFLHKQIK